MFQHELSFIENTPKKTSISNNGFFLEKHQDFAHFLCMLTKCLQLCFEMLYYAVIICLSKDCNNKDCNNIKYKSSIDIFSLPELL